MPTEHLFKKPVPNSSEGLLNHSDSWNILVIVFITLFMNTWWWWWWLILILIWYRINLFFFFFRERQEGSSERLNFVYYFIQVVSLPEMLQFALERINPSTDISSDCCQQFLSLLFVSFLENRNLCSHSAFRQLMKYCREVIPWLA